MSDNPTMGTCKTCKYWVKWIDTNECGTCALTNSENDEPLNETTRAFASTTGAWGQESWGDLTTYFDFGCNQYKAKQ